MRDRPEILLFGGSGQLGHELRNRLARIGHVSAPSREEADFNKPESLRAVISRYRPQLIVNAAAYTAVDKAESESAAAEAVNCLAPRVMAEEADALGAVMIHYSTDYVFDGRKTLPYEETDTPNPLSVYGRTKLDGEHSVAEACRRHLILRTSWLFGYHGANFLKTILRLAAERSDLRVVADQTGAPTSTAEVAEATMTMLHRLQTDAQTDGLWGVYHVTAAGQTTWHEYASYIVRKAAHRVPLKLAVENVVPISSVEYGAPAMRPMNSVLSTRKARDAFGVSMKDWKHGVDRVLSALLSTAQP